MSQVTPQDMVLGHENENEDLVKESDTISNLSYLGQHGLQLNM